ncbi:MAG: hypothetical protein ACRC2T_17310, partial [Thermoguttaceae bacterium]
MQNIVLDKEFLNWLIRGADDSGKKLWKDRLTSLLRQKVEKPVIYIGTGTCGLGAGAEFTLKAIRDYLTRKSIDAEVVEVGCIGLCVVEPLVDIQLPGKCRIMFQTVTAAKVDNLLDSIFSGNVPKDIVLGQFRQEGAQPWEGVQFKDEHPFFGPQTRWVLKNCGIIDPASLEEYLAHGGYRGLHKTLTENDPLEVCKIVEQSGLRGRGGGGFPTGMKWKFAFNVKDASQK